MNTENINYQQLAFLLSDCLKFKADWQENNDRSKEIAKIIFETVSILSPWLSSELETEIQSLDGSILSRTSFQNLINWIHKQVLQLPLENRIKFFSNHVVYHSRYHKESIRLPEYLFHDLLKEINSETNWKTLFKDDFVTISRRDPKEKNILYHRKSVIIERNLEDVADYILNNNEYFLKQKFVDSIKVVEKLGEESIIYHQTIKIGLKKQEMTVLRQVQMFNGQKIAIGCSIDSVLNNTNEAEISAHIFSSVSKTSTKYTLIFKASTKGSWFVDLMKNKKIFISFFVKGLKELKKDLELI